MRSRLRRLSPLALLVLAVAAATARPAAAAVIPPKVTLFRCANTGGTQPVAAGADAILYTGWLAASPFLTLVGVLDTNLQVSINGVPVRHIFSYYSPPQPDPPYGWVMNWNDDLGPISGPVTVTTSGAFYYPIVDGVTFNQDGSPYYYSGLYFSGSCTLVPAVPG